MAVRKYLISMSKEEMIHYYAEKIVNDGIRECTEFNTTIDLANYCNTINLKNYKNELLKELYKSEKLADVTIDDDYTIDMFFYTDYCPFYYDEVQIFNKTEERTLLNGFADYCYDCVQQDGCLILRNLINDYKKSLLYMDTEKQEDITNVIKKNLIISGFVEKNIHLNNEVYIDLDNIKSFERLVEKRTKELTQEIEQQSEEEEEM